MYKERKLRDLTVSPIGMGCMGFSHGYGKVPEKNYAINAIRKAHDFGCTLFDTAESYGQEIFYAGHNEELVGEAVKEFRPKVTLATKFHLHPEDFGSGVNLHESVRKHLDLSLHNLKTDYVDLYYLHRVHEKVPVEEIAEVMGRLIKEGLIRGWGLSAVGVDTIAKAQAVTPLSAVQNIYSMLERDSEKEIIPYCLANRIGFVPFSPIASGFLSGKVTAETKFEGDDVRQFVPQLSKENIEGNQPILRILEKYAEEKHATKAQISLAWMLHKYPNVVPIPGSKNLQRILENLGAWNVELTEEEFNSLEKALDSCQVFGHRGAVETEQTSFGKNWEENR